MNLLKDLGKTFKKVVQYDPIGKNLPETQMTIEATQESNANPYGDQRSAFDILGAGPIGQITRGGQSIGLDPNEPRDRRIGRTIGTMALAYMAGGMLAGGQGGGAGGAAAGGAEGGGTAAGGASAGSGAASSATSAAEWLKTAKTVASIVQPVIAIASSVNAKNAADEAAAAADRPITVTVPPTAPTRGNENTIKAYNQAISQQTRRRGRASTILTQPSESLGAV